MRKIRKHAAGIDISAGYVYVGLEDSPVVTFETYTTGLYQVRDYLLEKGVTTVAMEATGVYWIILYDILEEAGLEPWLVDGRTTRNLPGRKTDVKDCQWIQELHAHGLLKRCFIPEEEVKEVREYQRRRKDLIEQAGMYVQHMDRALVSMNIRLSQVLSPLKSASGLRMIAAIIAGERNAKALLELCHSSIKTKKADQVLKALEGRYTDVGLFALEQGYDAYLFCQQQITQCEHRIELAMKKINRYDEDPEARTRISGVKNRKQIAHNKPDIDYLGGHLMEIFANRDATRLPGISDHSWLQLYGELGANLKAWPTEKHFTSYLLLAPSQHQSGKMAKRRNRKVGTSKAGQIFRMCARSVVESRHLALGAWGRKIKAKKGPGPAYKAVARKLATLYWRMMVNGLEYTERGIEEYERQVRDQQLQNLHRQAKRLGVQVLAN